MPSDSSDEVESLSDLSTLEDPSLNFDDLDGSNSPSNLDLENFGDDNHNSSCQNHVGSGTTSQPLYEGSAISSMFPWLLLLSGII